MFNQRKLLVGLFALLLACAAPLTAKAVDPFFFSNSVNLGGGVYYSDNFGYYNLDYYSQGYIYKYSFGYLYYLGDDGGDGDYFYDFTADDYFYTSFSLYRYNNYAYIYSFNRRTYLFYFEESNPREFYDYARGQYIFY